MSPKIGPVSAEFKSVYRLFLRTISRAAGSDRHTFHSLRRLSRPSFRAAGRNIMKLDDAGRQAEHENLRKWLETWDKRVDNTMSFFTNAAMSHGLPLTMLRKLPVVERGVRMLNTAGLERRKWNPQLSEDDREYKIKSILPNTKDAAKWAVTQKRRELVDNVYNPVGEVIKLAEGRHNLTLGRVLRRRHIP